MVGDPVDLSAFAGRPLDKATLTEATNVIMEAITELLATLRGGQPPLVRWDPAAHNQSTHGRFIDQDGKTGSSASGAGGGTPDAGSADAGTATGADGAK